MSDLLKMSVLVKNACLQTVQQSGSLVFTQRSGKLWYTQKLAAHVYSSFIHKLPKIGSN